MLLPGEGDAPDNDDSAGGQAGVVFAKDVATIHLGLIFFFFFWYHADHWSLCSHYFL